MKFIDKCKLILEHKSSFDFLDSVPFLEFNEAKPGSCYSVELLPAYYCVSRNQKGLNPFYDENVFSIKFDFDENEFVLSSFLGKCEFDIEMTLSSLIAVRNYYESKFEAHLRKQAEDKKAKTKPESVDHLYLIHDTVLNALKIGRSKSPKKRLETLQTSTANRLDLICVAEKIGNFEKSVHDKFKHLRLASEWFQYSGEITNFFNSLNSVAV